MSTPNTQTDPDDLEWLRQIRRKITNDFGHDQKKIGDYLREREKAMGARPRPHAEARRPGQALNSK